MYRVVYYSRRFVDYFDAEAAREPSVIISAAYLVAHAADFDTKMTKVVFETMLKVINCKRSQVKVSTSLPQVVLKYNKKLKMYM